MSQRDGYEHGVPSWIAGAHPHPAQAAAFYTELFGWQTDPRGDHLVCTLRGRDVAGFVQGDAAAWRTTVWVESADDTAERATDAGGSVVTAPFELPGVGRTAVLADPAGAVFTVSEPDPHRGAQVVNEPGAWAMSALATPDLEGAKAFYGAVFGWETDTFAVGEIEATLWRLPGFEGGEPEQPVPDATAAKADELGGSVLMPPTDLPIGRRAILADPQGGTFSVSRVVPA